MAAHGRPTPQAESTTPGRPRFRDRLPEHMNAGDGSPFKDVNPFLERHRTYGRPVLTADEAWRFRGRWDACFERDAPLHVEIGSGNGFFLAGMAARHPERNFLGIEIRYKRVVMCAEKLDKAGVTNGRIARYHAGFLDDLFEPGSIAGMYVNHPDPWPRGSQRKNRLIARWFLEDCAHFLAPGAHFRLKSDFEDNVARVPRLLEQDGVGGPAERLPFDITGRSDDVITGPAPWPDDIETNYQSKFRRKGEPVYAIQLTRTDALYTHPDRAD